MRSVISTFLLAIGALFLLSGRVLADAHHIDYQYADGLGCEDCHTGAFWTMTCEDCHVTGVHSSIWKDGGGNPIVNANGMFIMDLQPFDKNYNPRTGPLVIVWPWFQDANYTAHDARLANGMICQACHSDHAWIDRPTCEGCHISGSHCDPGFTCIRKGPDGSAYLDENGSYILDVLDPDTWTTRSWEVPVASHDGFPTIMFADVDCRTCHIVDVRYTKRPWVADYTTIGPDYNATTELGVREQFTQSPPGTPPYYAWTQGSDGVEKVYPVLSYLRAAWEDANGEIPFSNVTAAAQAVFGFADSTIPEGGDHALIVNTRDEIVAMVSELEAQGHTGVKMVLRPGFRILNHSVAPVGLGKILGETRGCIECHSSSDPASPYYTPYSRGFLNRYYRFFDQPVEGGKGLVQYVDVDGPHVSAEFCGVDTGLWIQDNETVPDGVPGYLCQGYSPDVAMYLMNPGSAGIPMPSAWFGWVQKVTSNATDTTESAVRSDTAVTRTVIFDASESICPSGNCTFRWDFESDGAWDYNTTQDERVVEWTYGTGGAFNATLLVVDNLTGLRSKVRNMTWTYDPSVPGGSQVYVSDGTPYGHEFQVDVAPENTPPDAGFTLSGGTPNPDGSYELHAGDTLTLTDTSTDAEGNLAGFRVRWGDEGVDGGEWTVYESEGPSGGSVDHVYANPGTYKLRFFAYDSGGLEGKAADVKIVVLP